MTDKELMQQALETLENLQGLCTDAADGWVEAVTIWTPEVIAALRERLAQPEQQPDFWMDTLDVERRAPTVITHYEKVEGSPAAPRCIHPMWISPQRSEQKLVAAIRAGTEQIAALVWERDELQKKVWRYEKHGVTCQTYGHVVGACAECNTHGEAEK